MEMTGCLSKWTSHHLMMIMMIMMMVMMVMIMIMMIKDDSNQLLFFIYYSSYTSEISLTCFVVFLKLYYFYFILRYSTLMSLKLGLGNLSYYDLDSNRWFPFRER